MKVILALDASTEDRLIGPLLAAGHEIVARPAGGVELATAMRSLAADAALAASSPRMLSSGVLAAADAAGIRLVALAAGEEEHAVAASLGIREVLDATAAWGEIEALLAGRTVARGSEPQRPGGRGRVVAVWGPAGGPGRTTTAITLAAEAALADRRVLLADADTYGAAIAPALGLLDEAPGFAAACRLAGAGALTAAELDRVSDPYRLGTTSFAVLTGLSRPSRWPELSADRVKGALSVCRSSADITVVDTGFNLESDEEIASDLFAPRRNAATLAALAEADLVVAVGAADPVGLARFLRAHAELADIVAPETIRTVITKVRASAVGVSPASQISSTLLRFGGITEPTLVPHDPAAYDAALLTGRTLQEAAPRSPALAALRRLAAGELLRPTGAREAAASRRLWSALRRGQDAPPMGA